MPYIEYPDIFLVVVWFCGLSAWLFALYDLVKMNRHLDASERAWKAVVIRLDAIEKNIKVPRSSSCANVDSNNVESKVNEEVKSVSGPAQAEN